MDILRIAVLGIAGVMIALLLRKEKGEYSTFISMAVCICIFIYIITKVETVLLFVERLESLVLVDGTYIAQDMAPSQGRLRCLPKCPYWW